MNKWEVHSKKVERLQNSIKSYGSAKERSSAIALHYSGYSNTTRTKRYKQNCPRLDFGSLNEVLQIDPEKMIAIVEPRVTMERLLRATLPFQLIPAILPECRGITVGGAIMGGAGESSSHQWGCFNDICRSYQILCGDGSLLRASPYENRDIFYGVAGSYGSLGALVSAEIELIAAQKFVYLRYHVFSDPLKAIGMMQSLLKSHERPDFLDGIIFAKDLTVVMEGNLHPTNHESNQSSLFSLASPLSEWFYQHVKKIGTESQGQIYHEKMTLEDYFFRYDLGGFWMGAYLFQIPFLARFVTQGIFGFRKPIEEHFSESEIYRFHSIKEPHVVGRAIFRPFLNTQNLLAILHKAEHWVQNRMVIQDFCIPESKAKHFCKEILNNLPIFPVWLCPIKRTYHPQIFAPHFLSENHVDGHLINFGLYGIPLQSKPIRCLTKMLEQSVHAYGGRKALYSRSYYTLEEFWQIYPRGSYEDLRKITHAHGVWHEITDKVLSE